MAKYKALISSFELAFEMRINQVEVFMIPN